MVRRSVSVALILVLGSTVEAFVPSACLETSTRRSVGMSASRMKASIGTPPSRRISRTELESSSTSSSSPSHLGSSRTSDESSETDETSKSLSSIEDEQQQNKELVLKAFLTKEYSAFAKFLSLNAGIWERLDKESAVTVFVPTNEAFEKLGEKRLRQLRDVRNEETAQKIGLYHVVVGDAVSSARLRTEDWTVKLPAKAAGQQPRPIKVSGLVTMGGEVPVDRAKPAQSAAAGPGLLQRMFGGGTDAATMDSSNNKSNNDICIGPAGRLQKTYKLDNGKYYVHEMDGFISPDILWRYCDQLRIPGF
jgi:uncharacterized surface protein with fasciclin (FAS1) repeats